VRIGAINPTRIIEEIPMKTLNGLLTVLLLAATSFPSFAGQATDATQEANQAVRDYLPFDDNTDFKNAERGFIATIDEGRIMDDKGGVIFDMKQFDFLDQSDPDTVNPSLWRQSKMNAMNGLYKVSDGIYQVRGFDLANISFIRGKTGWIVIDPLTANETAVAAFELLQEHVEKAPVSAMIFTHSHVDHFGGAKGLVTQEEVDSGKIPVIAPHDFFIESVNENLIMGMLCRNRPRVPLAPAWVPPQRPVLSRFWNRPSLLTGHLRRRQSTVSRWYSCIHRKPKHPPN
jgi:alkyl sulfatase BDS1-like metallo-beta-lactamase superfamily hydrolase